MFKKGWQILVLAMMAFGVFLLQFSLVSSLPSFWFNLNLPLIMVIFAVFFYDWRLATVLAIICGLCLDFTSFYPWGLNVAILLFAVASTQLILMRLLTNRSLYSFVFLIILTGLATAIMREILLLMFSGNYTSFFLLRPLFWKNLAYESLWGILFSLLMFNGAGFLSRRLQPFFLEKK